jgi:hypothetical protein
MALILRARRAPYCVRRRLCYEERWLRTDQRSVPWYRYGRGQTDPATHERLPLAKQAEVGEMLADMQQRGVVEGRELLAIPRHPEERGPELLRVQQ